MRSNNYNPQANETDGIFSIITSITPKRCATAAAPVLKFIALNQCGFIAEEVPVPLSLLLLQMPNLDLDPL